MFNPQRQSQRPQHQQGSANSSLQYGGPSLSSTLAPGSAGSLPYQYTTPTSPNTSAKTPQRIVNGNYDRRTLNEAAKRQQMIEREQRQSPAKSSHLGTSGQAGSSFNLQNSQYPQQKTTIDRQGGSAQAKGNAMNVALLTRKEDIRLMRTRSTFSQPWRWLHILLVCSYSIVAVVMTAIMMYYFPTDTGELTQLAQLIDNWNTELIESVEVKTLSATEIANGVSIKCSDGYSYLNIFEGQSIKAGCDCKSSTTASSKTILVGTCTSQQISQGCTNISPLSKPKGFEWITPDGLTVFGLCAKRISGLTYKQNGSTTSCEKTCGGTTDKTKFCVSTGQQCPLNYIKIGAAGSADASLTDINPIPIGASVFLFTSAKSSAAPLAEARVTKGPGVCINNNSVQNIYSTSTIHPLLDRTLAYSCVTTDARFQTLISLTEDKVLSSNYLTTKYSAIPDYTISTSETYSIYTRPIIALSSDRRTKDIQTILDVQSDYWSIQQVGICVLVTQCVYLLFVGIICSLHSVIKIIGKHSSFREYLFNINAEQRPMKEKSKIFQKLLLKLIISAIHFASILVAFIMVLRYLIKLQSLTEGTAIGDAQTVTLFKTLRTTYYDKILWYIVVNFIVYLSLILIELLCLVPLCSKKLRESTDVKIAKKYRADVAASTKAKQAFQFQEGIEIPEYQAQNMYAGNGINTTTQSQYFNRQSNFLSRNSSNNQTNDNISGSLTPFEPSVSQHLSLNNSYMNFPASLRNSANPQTFNLNNNSNNNFNYNIDNRLSNQSEPQQNQQPFRTSYQDKKTLGQQLQQQQQQQQQHQLKLNNFQHPQQLQQQQNWIQFDHRSNPSRQNDTFSKQPIQSQQQQQQQQQQYLTQKQRQMLQLQKQQQLKQQQQYQQDQLQFEETQGSQAATVAAGMHENPYNSANGFERRIQETTQDFEYNSIELSASQNSMNIEEADTSRFQEEFVSPRSGPQQPNMTASSNRQLLLNQFNNSSPIQPVNQFSLGVPNQVNRNSLPQQQQQQQQPTTTLNNNGTNQGRTGNEIMIVDSNIPTDPSPTQSPQRNQRQQIGSPIPQISNNYRQQQQQQISPQRQQSQMQENLNQQGTPTEQQLVAALNKLLEKRTLQELEEQSSERIVMPTYAQQYR